MAQKPAAPPPSGGAGSRFGDAARAAQREEREGDEERFGPLALVRLRKEDGRDGRALIVYSHSELGERGGPEDDDRAEGAPRARQERPRG